MPCIVLAFAVSAGAAAFFLPPATDDERALLTLMARSIPVTTCIALKTVPPSVHRATWSDTYHATALAHAQAQAVHRDASLAIDTESIVDNILRFTCDEKVLLSTPGFSGNLAFVEQSGSRMRETVAFEKRAGRWQAVARDVTPLNAVVID